MVKKLFLILVFTGGAAMSVPDLRARARPHLEPAFGDVMDWWAARLEPVTETAWRWSAANELRAALRSLREAAQRGQPLPDPEHFHTYVMQLHLSGRGGRDPWGSPYYLIVTRDSLIGGSAGPDGERDTADDIRVSVSRW
ncbi:MAG: hypothetical protein DIU52_014065 [bacterium]|jgi:hypothetical protein